MKTLLITGGSSGIGQATCLFFVQKGYRVFEMSRHEVSIEGVTHITGDVTQPADCQRAVSQVFSEAGELDVLICNAGMGISGSIEFAVWQDEHQQMEVNYFGAVNMVQAVLPYFRERKVGRILIVSSLASHFSLPFQSFYSASKAALDAMAKALRNEVSPWGIQVGCLLPGDVKTGFTSARNKNLKGEDIYLQQNKTIKAMEQSEINGIAPSHFAHKLYKMATARRLSLFNYVGIMAHLQVFLYHLLPATWVNWLVSKVY